MKRFVFKSWMSCSLLEQTRDTSQLVCHILSPRVIWFAILGPGLTTYDQVSRIRGWDMDPNDSPNLLNDVIFGDWSLMMSY